MKLLAIDTATEALSVALWDDGAVEANDAGRVRAGDAGGERERAFDESGDLAGGYGVRAVRVFAAGENVACVDALRAERYAGVDGVHV